MTESNEAVPTPSADVMQLARLLQARDALEFGYVVDVVAHPTWEEESLIGRDDYITQAASTLDLVRLCGWSSGEELERARATAVRLEQELARAEQAVCAELRAAARAVHDQRFADTKEGFSGPGDWFHAHIHIENQLRSRAEACGAHS